MHRHLIIRAIATTLAALTVRAQCPPATSYIGFHQERVGFAIAAQGDEALFGHQRGWNSGFFERRGNDWWWRTALMGGSGSGPARMGYTVALEGDIAVLGDAWDYSLPGFASFLPNGAAVVYERTAGTWARVTDIYPAVPTASVQFGLKVAIADDGSRVIVGAPLHAPSGAVHVYTRQPAGWVLEGTIAGASLSPPAAIGAEFALTGGRLFVTDDNGAGGAVRMLTLQGGTWTEVGALAPVQLAQGAGFGSTIVVDGVRVVIGAPLQPNSGSSATGVLFEYDISQPNWMAQPTTIVPPAGSTTAEFGRSLALDGDRLAIGAIAQAFEYRRSAGTWQHHATVEPPSYGYSSQFAQAVALYTNGLLVGDAFFDDDPLQYPVGPGGVHAFDLTDHGQPFQGCGRGVAIEYGGSLRLEIDWPQQAGKSYQVFGSYTGFGPTAVGGIQVPLTVDLYTHVLLAHPSFLAGGTGALDSSGQASVSWVVPAGLPLSLNGVQFHHAVVAYDASSLAASNAVTSRLIRFF